MEGSRKAKKKLIVKSYTKLVLMSMLVLGATNFCGFIDNIVISRYLGDDALAAVGYFSPVAALASLAYVIILGTVILCGNFIGSGERQKVNSLFTGAFFTIVGISSAFVLVLVFFRAGISGLLGAKGQAATLLMEYMLGFAPGILFSNTAAFLLSLTSYNNEIRISCIAALVLFGGNVLADVVLVGPLGLFGVGLASTISSGAMFAILLPGFLKRNKTIHLEPAQIKLGLVWEAVKRGMPSLLFNVGLIMKNSLLNYSLITYSGDAGIAVVNVLASICGITGTVLGGFVNSYATLGSLYYGEEDREGLLDLFKTALLSGFLISVAMASVTTVFSGPLSNVFFSAGTDIWLIGKRMFMLGFWYLPLNLIFNLLMNTYKAQGKMHLVNILSFVETAIIGILAVLTVPVMGTDAAWLANTWSDILILLIILILLPALNKEVSYSLPYILRLDDSFGATGEQFVEYEISDIEGVSAVSEAVKDFCKNRGMDRKKSFWASLCVEELTHNIIQHGGYQKKRNNVDVRVICKNSLTIRVQDDCVKFDPSERMKMLEPDQPEKNIGFRIVSKLATSMDYYNNAGINTLIIKL